MPRIAGVDIPANKPIWISLTYIFGIGKTLSKVVLEKAGIKGDVRANKLSEAEMAKVRSIIEEMGFKVEGDLRREIQSNIKHLKDIGAYRGMRHIRNLPCRGQRTHTNARTRKGRKRIAIAGKKVSTGPT